MRRKDKEIKDRGLILEMLEKCTVWRLGIVDGNEAYIVPLNYAYSEGALYFHTAPAGRKIELISKNNHVSFEMEAPGEIIQNEVPCEWSAKYRSLMGRGIVTPEYEPVLKKAALDLIMRKYGAGGDLLYDPAVLDRMIVLRLQIESVTGKQSGDW